ncbi:MAG: EAL domain-containing protein [Halioglobus sp.]|nr:EAL domain-containing protein [Halioglobus sp.]
MKLEHRNSWARDIHRQVYELVLILTTLFVVAGGYNIWSHMSVDDVRNDINDYHMVAISHYLRAMEELRGIQVQHAEGQNRRADDAQAGGAQPLTPIGNQLPLIYHIVNDSIGRGLALERQYDDRRFDALSKKLARQASQLAQGFEQLGPKGGDTKLMALTSSMLVSLEQLTRLHSITREQELEALHSKEMLQDRVYYFTMLVLLLVAVLVAQRSFGSIRRIIQTQIGAEKKIEYQAHYDSLTNLPNRFLAIDRLQQMISDAKRNNTRVAVLFIDLDYFKKINDMLGHLNADRLLVEYAQRIVGSVRAGDTVGRLGGDEFVVLAGGIEGTDEVRSIAEKLIARINEVFMLDGKELALTASIGISIYPDDDHDRLELIRKADSAMYHSKEAGRNTYTYYDESMNRKASRQLALEDQLGGALDRGEFSLVFQQKVDLTSNRIVGAEALLRWHNETLGQVPPDEFIPVAEQMGMIVPIGHFVLGKALEMTRQWRDELAAEFRIAVNLSPRQFRDPDLVNTISRLLHEAGVPSGALELEITEGVLLSDYIHIDQALADLKKLGIELVMDDFGTGYSSLSYLRQYPFGVIKIDRSFIRDIDTDPKALQLNHAAIAMAHALNIRVVAEGIETQAQHALLRDLDCDVAQGYYFGRPVPAEQMTEVLQAQRQQSRSQTVVDISEHGRPANKPQPRES